MIDALAIPGFGSPRCVDLVGSHQLGAPQAATEEILDYAFRTKIKKIHIFIRS